VVIASISLFREVLACNREKPSRLFRGLFESAGGRAAPPRFEKYLSPFDAGERANVAGLDLFIDELEAATDSILEFLPELTVDAMVAELQNQLTEREFP